MAGSAHRGTAPAEGTSISVPLFSWHPYIPFPTGSLGGTPTLRTPLGSLMPGIPWLPTISRTLLLEVAGTLTFPAEPSASLTGAGVGRGTRMRQGPGLAGWPRAAPIQLLSRSSFAPPRGRCYRNRVTKGRAGWVSCARQGAGWGPPGSRGARTGHPSAWAPPFQAGLRGPGLPRSRKAAEPRPRCPSPRPRRCRGNARGTGRRAPGRAGRPPAALAGAPPPLGAPHRLPDPGDGLPRPLPGRGANGRADSSGQGGAAGEATAARRQARAEGADRPGSPTMASKCPKCDKTVYFGECPGPPGAPLPFAVSLLPQSRAPPQSSACARPRPQDARPRGQLA